MHTAHNTMMIRKKQSTCRFGGGRTDRPLALLSASSLKSRIMGAGHHREAGHKCTRSFTSTWPFPC